MALTVKLTPGYVYTDNELDTAAKRNALGNPTVELEGAISSVAIADGSVTTPKLADGVLSNDDAGHAKMATNYLSADATGRSKMQDGYVTAAKLDPALLTSLEQATSQYAVSSLVTGVYHVNLTPAPTVYTEGMRVVFRVDLANPSGGESINVNSIGPVILKAQSSIPLVAFQLMAGEIVTCVFDGTNFQIENGAGRYTTAELTIGFGNMLSTAHGLGIVPTAVHWVLRCKVADVATGYAVGDEVSMSCAQFASGGFTNPAFNGGANATNVFLTCGVVAGAGAFGVLSKSTGAEANVTNSSNWKVVGYLRR